MGVYWGQKRSYQLSPQEQVKPGDGINTYGNAFDIKKSECVSSLNTSNRLYPSLTVRPGMSKEFNTGTTALTTVNSVGSRLGTTFHVQDGTSWKYWTPASRAWSEKVTTPDVSNLTVFNNKLYGVSSSTLYEWNGTNAWASKSSSLSGIKLTVFNNKLYSIGAKRSLYEWNGTNAWVEKVAQTIYTEKMFLTVLGSTLYGCDDFDGTLYYWNGTTAWVQVAPNYGFPTPIELVTYSGKIYMLDSVGRLYEWNGVDAWVMKVSSAGTFLANLIVFNGNLYGTYQGNLYQWDGASSYILKTSGNLGETIACLAIYNGKLCAGTGTTGYLFEWNDVDAWVSKTDRIGTETKLSSLAALGAKLYCTSYADGHLHEWGVGFTTVVASGLANSKGKIIEYNTQAKRYSILVNGTDKQSWDGTDVVDLTAAPATKLYISADNRLYALIGSILKYSALGTTNDWTTLDDAGEEVLTEMIGVGTALVAYNDMKIAFSEQTMHVVYGKNIFEYTIASPFADGCVGDKAVIVSSGVLYFVDFNKIKMFTGGIPVDISQKVKAYLELINYTYRSLICAGKWGKYVYFSIPYGTSSTTNTLTLEYDTELKTWYPINRGFTDFVTLDEDLYGIDNSGVAWKLNQGLDDSGTAIVWKHETGVQDGMPLRQRKTISDIWALVDLPVASTMLVYYSLTTDLDDWTLLYTFVGNANEQNTRIQIPTTALQNIPWYRLKFSGTGYAAIHFWEPHVRIKKR